jgi:hypothetical protein
MGFANHGGMWSDLVLLPMANAVIVPHLTFGPWIVPALIVTTVASLWVHMHWYRRDRSADDLADVAHHPVHHHRDEGDHVWPSHARGSWSRDLSWSGWAHVVYVVGELSLLIGFLIHPVPEEAVLLVAAIFTIHVPIGLLQPRWYRNGHIATVSEQPLLAPLLIALWAVVMIKL